MRRHTRNLCWFLIPVKPTFRSCWVCQSWLTVKCLGSSRCSAAKHVFNEDEEAFLTTLAAQLATSIERAESQGRFSTEQATHVIKGVAGAPGMAIGVALVLNRGVNLESVPDKRTEISTVSCKTSGKRCARFARN